MTFQKKIFITALVMLLFLSGCGHQQIASDKAIMLGKKAIEVGEAYLNGDLDGTSAQNDLDEILDKLSYADNYTSEEKRDDKQKNADYYIHFYVFSLNARIFFDSARYSDAETFDSVKEAVEDLKQTVKKYD